jgi:nucleoside-diphosphate-sugar epimerase
MRILITGNMGYVGAVLTRHLRSRFPNAELIGYDTGYFARCLQHECGHLDGGLYIDVLSGDVRREAMRAIRDLRR